MDHLFSRIWGTARDIYDIQVILEIDEHSIQRHIDNLPDSINRYVRNNLEETITCISHYDEGYPSCEREIIIDRFYVTDIRHPHFNILDYIEEEELTDIVRDVFQNLEYDFTRYGLERIVFNEVILNIITPTGTQTFDVKL